MNDAVHQLFNLISHIAHAFWTMAMAPSASWRLC
jgi:hypothetical protein